MNKEFINRFQHRKSEQIAYFKPFKGHIHNPGMGIISMAISDHMVTGYTPEERAANDRKPPFTLTYKMLEDVTKLSYIDNLYIRVGWNDIQQKPGKLTLSPEFEMAVEAARDSGISWGFRIMQASPSNAPEHLIPEFLLDKLQMYPYFDGDKNQRKRLPLYTDEYLKYWDEMLMMLGEKYDNDPSLEYGDVSGFGLWGEGHHGCHMGPGGSVVDLNLDTPERTEEVVRNLIESHKKAFVLTPMVLNLVLSEYKAGQNAIKEGCWVRRDSYYGWFQAEQAEYGLMKRGDAAMIFETVMPGLDTRDQEDISFRHNFLDTPDKMCDYGAAYGIVGFNPLDTLYADHVFPQLFNAFKNRVGYRLRPSIVWRVRNKDDRWSLVLGMVNDGVANPPGDVYFYAKSNGNVCSTKVNGSKFGGRMYLVELPLPIDCQGEVELTMELAIGGKKRSVRFAADVCQDQAPFKLVVKLEH